MFNREKREACEKEVLNGLNQLNSYDYFDECSTSTRRQLACQCGIFLTKVGLVHNYKWRNAWVGEMVAAARQRLYNDKLLGKKLTGFDGESLPRYETKTCTLQKNKLTLNTTIGSIDKAQTYYSNAEKYKIYGPETKCEFVFGLFSKKTGGLVFCVLVPNYKKGEERGGKIARANMQDHLNKRCWEQKMKAETGENPGRDSYEVKWGHIAEDPTIRIVVNELDDIEWPAHLVRRPMQGAVRVRAPDRMRDVGYSPVTVEGDSLEPTAAADNRED